MSLVAPTRAAALARLEEFAPRMGSAYAATRNHDHGPGNRENVSCLSAHVRHRLVTEAELAAAALAHHGPVDCEKFIQEVFWRSYWKGWLEMRPTVWAEYRQAVAREHAGLATQAGLRRAYEAAVAGRTGIACFDAWARELVETGYLHNHTRMWFASIWIFTLRLPWVLGADFTYRHFIDGDPASNTLSWRWVAGLHTRGKHYLARAGNIATYTDERFNPRGELDEQASPLDEPPYGAATIIPAASPTPEGNVALLLTEEDCCAESWTLGRACVVAVGGFTCTAARSPLPLGVIADRFAHASITDALARAGAHFAVEPARLAEPHAVADWATASGARMVVTAYAPVGPVAEALDEVAGALSARGIALARLRSSWDEAVWPHAAKGFFQVKARIPAILRSLGHGA